MKRSIWLIGAFLFGLTFATYAQHNERHNSNKRHDKTERYSNTRHHKGDRYYTKGIYDYKGPYVYEYNRRNKNRFQGNFTKHELKNIRHLERDLNRYKYRAWQDGFLNRRERAIIRTKEYRLSDYIYHARHNRNKRF